MEPFPNCFSILRKAISNAARRSAAKRLTSFFDYIYMITSFCLLAKCFFEHTFVFLNKAPFSSVKTKKPQQKMVSFVTVLPLTIDTNIYQAIHLCNTFFMDVPLTIVVTILLHKPFPQMV
jgi:hypothetical protein